MFIYRKIAKSDRSDYQIFELFSMFFYHLLKMSNDEQKIYRLCNQANIFENPHSQHFYKMPKIEIQQS